MGSGRRRKWERCRAACAIAGGACGGDITKATLPRGRCFGGNRVNVVQIGLGTFGTFIQNLAGRSDEWSNNVKWLLDACSIQRTGRISGGAVEPVREHVDRLCVLVDRLQFVELVQVAIGEDDGVDNVHLFSVEMHMKIVMSVLDL